MTGPFRWCLALWSILAGATAWATVLDPPTLRCASVNAGNDVTLTWTPPADPGGDFDYYEIFHGTDPGGPFTSIGTVNVLAQTTFIHVGSGAGTAAQYYVMTTVSTAPPPNVSIPSDTVATLFLEVFQSTPLGSANLAWSAGAVAPTAASTFSVWMEYPVGTWQLLAEVPDTTYAYQWVVSICEDSLTFRVGLADAGGCISFSNRDGDVFEDVTPPESPVITTVSVDSTNGLSTITWSPSTQPDTEGYIVVWVTPGGGIIIDTLFGQFNTSYTWPLSTPGDGPESFTLAAFDTCRVGVPPAPNTSATRPPHSTVHASTQYDQCAGQMTLLWTPYVGRPVVNYRVFRRVDGGPWLLQATTGPDEFSLVQSVDPDRAYCFLVRADIADESGTYSSLSNVACRNSVYPDRPGYNYLRTVTVTGPGQITVVDSVDFGSLAGAYLLERSNGGGPFEQVAIAPGTAGPVITFVDDDVDPALVGYRYRVVVLDSCGNEAVTSNIGGNIVLQARATLNGENELQWNGYALWAGMPVSHAIHRSIDDGPFGQLVLTPPDPWEFVDEVQDFTASTGRFCYYVEAFEGGNPSGINARSVSNVACAVQEELVYIPNAFIVGGANPVFIPVLTYVDVVEYELSIINRWGQVVWTTNDPLVGWDGDVDGQRVPIGIYAYYCSFRTGAGKRVDKRGTVTMLTAVD